MMTKLLASSASRTAQRSLNSAAAFRNEAGKRVMLPLMSFSGELTSTVPTRQRADAALRPPDR